MGLDHTSFFYTPKEKHSFIITTSLEISSNSSRRWCRQVKKRLLDVCLWLRRRRCQQKQLIVTPAMLLLAKINNTGMTTELMAVVYVLSGVSQPLLMTACKNAGLADPVAQLFMVFYYLGPSLFVFHTGFCCFGARSCSSGGGGGGVNFSSGGEEEEEEEEEGNQLQQHQPPPVWPSKRTQLQACGIAIFDIVAQAMNYTGASYAGPTIFAIVYASVTVWTAVWARIVLGRRHSHWQWTSFGLVFFGLCWTARSSTTSSNGHEGAAAADMAPGVLHGTLLVLFGSILHAGSYVLSEAIMSGQDRLSVAQNTTLQSLVACVLLIAWQFIYTIPRWHDVIATPMQTATAGGTTWTSAVSIMMAFAGANLLHSYSFYYTIKHYKGGSVMAGVMKGLQAVLVFGATHVLFCGKSVGSGSEMCFSQDKFVSLVVVVGGVCLFAASTTTTTSSSSSSNNNDKSTATVLQVPQRDGYMPVVQTV